MKYLQMGDFCADIGILKLCWRFPVDDRERQWFDYLRIALEEVTSVFSGWLATCLITSHHLNQEDMITNKFKQCHLQ